MESQIDPEDAPIAEGDFYMTDSVECLSCGVPQHEAPDLVGWKASRYKGPTSLNGELHTHCYWKKQPETPGEITRAINVINGQELGCHCYRGSDPDIITRIAVSGYNPAGAGGQSSTLLARMWGNLIRLFRR